MDFKLQSSYQPTGDQPQAIEQLTKSLDAGNKHQVLLGVTGSGKTFSMANIIQKVQKPTLIIAHNKTLAAQLYQEFRDFFPENAVSYFVSYYDYYQPEAYIPSSDTYIEKDSSINDEIDKLRLASTTNLMTRTDVIVIASVSCIYNLGSPVEYGRYMLQLVEGELIARETLLLQLANLQYERSETDLMRGSYRLRGDTIQIWPAYEDRALRIDTLENRIEQIMWVDPVSGNPLEQPEGPEGRSPRYILYPAKHYVVNPNSQDEALAQIRKDLNQRVEHFKATGKTVEAFRLNQKVSYDLEMIENLGFVNGIENYSRYFDGRKEGEAPFTLLDYFRENSKQFNTGGFLTFVDESHISVPQIGGMYNGDRARKETLIEYGFRLPSALDNRPLRFEEFLDRNDQYIHVSATPRDWELGRAGDNVAEQLIRPTGLVDPNVELRRIEGQIEDLVIEILNRKKIGQRTLVTTLTKKMAEALTDYLNNPAKINSLVESHLEKVADETNNPNPEQTIWANQTLPIEDMEIEPLDPKYYTQAKLETAKKDLIYPKVAYLHSEIDTLERSDILDDLRRGVYDVVVGINLLREGLDLPEVSLVAILDADKEGFLRSETSLIQTMGRAARHENGKAIMYADRLTGSMKSAISETLRRRAIQIKYNEDHQQSPQSISKPIREKMIKAEHRSKKQRRGGRSLTEPIQELKKTQIKLTKTEFFDLETFDPQALTPHEKKTLAKKLTRRMKAAANDMDFELATILRDTVAQLN